MIIKRDCKDFKGSIPCKLNKETGVNCINCNSYRPGTFKILIIKLGAIGDVIRTTPLLTRLIEIHQEAEIYWITHTPEMLPKEVDHKLKYNFTNVQILQAIEFDLSINLDKDWESCALLNSIYATEVRGYCLMEGKTSPVDSSAYEKYLTGIMDEVSKLNQKHYMQEIFEICDVGEFKEEPYLLSNGEKGKHNWNIDRSKTVIGLNTGCSARWSSRLWPTENWVQLAKALKFIGYEVVILGGEQEADINTEISLLSATKYFGVNGLNVFIDLVDNCDLVVSQITMAVHIALGLKKKVVVMNNIFNPSEFHLYGLGKLIEPTTGCDCYYLSECKRDRHCMKDITVDMILGGIQEVLI